MTLIFHFTDGVTTNSVSGVAPFTNTPYDTAISGITARTRPTTRQGIFDEIDFALTTAGWTRFQTVVGSDHVYTSAGESGNENLNIRLRHITSNRYLYFGMSTKLTAGNILDTAAEIGGTNSNQTRERWDLGTSDFSSDFQIIASLDFFTAVFQNINHTSSIFVGFLGNSIAIDENANVLTLSANVAAGTDVVLTPTTNPLVAGYRPGDLIEIVEVEPSSTATAERQLVTDVTSTTFTVANLANAYTGSGGGVGARLGQRTSPLIRGVWNNGTSGAWNPVLNPNVTLSDDILVASTTATGAGFDMGTVRSLWPAAHTDTAFGTGATPNNRSNRFTCRSLAFTFGNSLIGEMPRFLAYPGTVTYYSASGNGGHDHMENNRVTPTDRFSPMRFGTTATNNYLLGPVPK
jgi:hypothetical protein